MRKIEYLSPTSISMFYKNTEEFYLTYLAGDRAPRFPQTRPMSVGSAFDARVKSFLHDALCGKGTDPRFEYQAIFESQVEPHNRDWAEKAGLYAFNEYKNCGALSDLMLELQGSISTPRFEIEVKGVVNGYREGNSVTLGEVPLLGKPDLQYVNKEGANVVHDWKVNGFCSNYNVSPMKGYVRLRQDGMNKGQHKDAQLLTYKGVLINVTANLEDCNFDWARQLAIYGWLCGQEVGGDFIVSIDQLVCKPYIPDMPKIRVAEHRLTISPKFQRQTYTMAQHVWDVIHSGHIFRDLDMEMSKQKQDMLDRQAAELVGKGTDDDKWFAQVTRSR